MHNCVCVCLLPVERHGVRVAVVAGACAGCRAGVSSDSIAERERDARVERETRTMDTDIAMRWTRRSASRDADGCLWAGYGLVGGRYNDSDKTFIPFCAPRNTLTIERHGAPPGFTYREGRGATSLPPTSREERLRNELPKEKKDRMGLCVQRPGFES